MIVNLCLNLNVMKKILFSIALFSASLLMGQQPHSPMLFRNQLDVVRYQLDHPELFVTNATAPFRNMTVFSQKLDSVIGSDNFDWTRWKNEYDYGSDEIQPYDNRNRTEIHFVWENQTWQPELKSAYMPDDTVERTLFYRWNEGRWVDDQRVSYYYDESNGVLRLNNIVAEKLNDTVWQGTNHVTYQYDDQNRLVLMMNYGSMNEAGAWVENSKVEYAYDDDGSLVKRLSWTKRNNTWRENTKDTLFYDGNHRCETLLTQRKGFGGNSWRDASKYEFAYGTDGRLESETLYSSGWFGPEMTLESQSDYQYDAQGNLLRKTVSIFNGAEWIVRDQYENQYDHNMEASGLLGLTPIWESMTSNGMVNALDPMLSLYSQWLSCSIISTAFDSQFDLYYSGFAGVEETSSSSFKICVSDGSLMVENESDSDVVVYDLCGRVVAAEAQSSKAVFHLKPGLYLVSNGHSVVKAIVK